MSQILVLGEYINIFVSNIFLKKEIGSNSSIVHQSINNLYDLKLKHISHVFMWSIKKYKIK